VFGSNFAANFGIPDFGYQNADPQGGYLGTNAPAEALSQNAAPAGQPATSNPVAPAPTGSIAAPSPLAGGPLSLGGAQTPQQPNANPEPSQAPPAAGLGSPFGKPGV
jgi:hypothetical protein